MKSFLGASTILAVLFLSACGEDKTVEEHQRERLQENLAVFQSVAGRYTGKVVSLQDQSEVGALEVVLRAETQVNPSGGGESSIGSPILITNLRFLNKNIISMSAYNSFYDSKSGAFSAQIKISRSETEQPEILTLNGNLNASEFNGELSSVDYAEYGSRFRLVRNGPKLTDLAPKTSPDDFENGKGSNRITTYDGTTTFQNGSKRPVQIVMLQPLRGTAEDILDLVSPIKTVQASFNYSQSLHLLYSNSIWDVRQKVLTGETLVSVNGQSQKITLECRTSDAGKMYCNHLTTGAGATATSTASPSPKPPKPLPPDPDNRPSVTKIFAGKGVIAGKMTPIKIAVTHPSRGRFNDLMELFFPNSEKAINVAVDFSNNVSTSFMGIKWDAANGLVDGAMLAQGPGDSYTAYLQCYDFYFTSTKGPFLCNYWTSRSPNIAIDFQPPYK